MVIPQLFACKNSMMLGKQDVLLILDFSFDVFSGDTGPDLESDVLACRVFIKICISMSATQPPH